jgi:hypothetical protein
LLGHLIELAKRTKRALALADESFLDMFELLLGQFLSHPVSSPSVAPTRRSLGTARPRPAMHMSHEF